MELPLIMGAGQVQIGGHRFQCDQIEKGLGKITVQAFRRDFTIRTFESLPDATRIHDKGHRARGRTLYNSIHDFRNVFN